MPALRRGASRVPLGVAKREPVVAARSSKSVVVARLGYTTGYTSRPCTRSSMSARGRADRRVPNGGEQDRLERLAR